MASVAKKQNRKTRLVESLLRQHFSEVECYQYNPASIRTRIIDQCFRGLSLVERDDMVSPLLKALPEEVQADITILLLLSPDEVEQSMTNVEFEHPSPSML